MLCFCPLESASCAVHLSINLAGRAPEASQTGNRTHIQVKLHRGFLLTWVTPLRQAYTTSRLIIVVKQTSTCRPQAVALADFCRNLWFYHHYAPLRHQIWSCILHLDIKCSFSKNHKHIICLTSTNQFRDGHKVFTCVKIQRQIETIYLLNFQ